MRLSLNARWGSRQRKRAEQHSPVVGALGLAHYWLLLNEGKFSSRTDIAKSKGIDRAFVSRVSNLTREIPGTFQQ